MIPIGSGDRAGSALSSSDRSWTYPEVERAADALAEFLARVRTDPGARVMHEFSLNPESVVAVHAVARARAILALAHPIWSAAERDRFMGTVAPEIVLTSAGAVPVPDYRPETVALPGFPPVVAWRRSSPPGFGAGAPAPPGTQVLLSTSGSEGKPRLVCHTWPALVANARASNQRLDFGLGDAWLATLAWSHVGGLAVLLRAAVAGARLTLDASRFDAGGVVRALRARQITHLSLVPAMLHTLLDGSAAPTESLRVVLVGGAAVSTPLAVRAEERGWPIALTYGCTEAGSQVATAPPEETRADPSTVGSPLPGTEVRIRSGEIEVRGPTLFLGYLGETARTPGAWFRTGDLGSLDARGRLRVTGRRTLRIVTGGANVDPAEVEAVLARHPDVREACVMGTPDDVWGEVVTAFVVGRGEGLDRRLQHWAGEHLSGPRKPRSWRFLPALPRTSTGKVDRGRLASLSDLHIPSPPHNPNEAGE